MSNKFIVIPPEDRNLKIIDYNDYNAVHNPEETDESLFNVTKKDLLRALPKSQEDSYLMTKKHRDMKAKKKEEDFYKKYPECRIKISFSNNVSVEMSFHPGETILAVMEELQNIMENQDIFLFTIPARKILQPNATLLSCNLCPRGRCHAWLDDPKFLSTYWETRIIALPNDGLQKTHSTDFSGPRDASGSSGFGGKSASEGLRGSKPSRSGSVYGSSQGSSSSTVPKWFRGTTGKDHRK